MASSHEVANTLTPEAKTAIRAYLWRIAIPSAVALSVASAAFGFIVNELARGAAYSKAYSEASSEILKTASAAAIAQAQADGARQQVEASRAQVDLLVAEIKKIDDGAKSTSQEILQSKIQVDDFLKKNFEGVAKTLLGDANFRNSLVRVADSQFQALEARVGSLEKSLAGISVDLGSRLDQNSADVASIKTGLARWSPGDPVNGAHGGASMCPSGMYVVGMVFSSVPGGAHGYLDAGHVVCRPLNL